MNPLANRVDPDSVLAVYIKFPGQKMDYSSALAMAGLVKEQIRSSLDAARLLLALPPETKLIVSRIIQLIASKCVVPPETRAAHETTKVLVATFRKELELRKLLPGMDRERIQEDEKRLSNMEANLITLSNTMASAESLAALGRGFLKSAADSGSIFLLPGESWCILIAHVCSMVPALQTVKSTLARANLLEFSEIAHGDSAIDNFRTFHPTGFTEPFGRHIALIREPMAKALVMLAMLIPPSDPDEPPNRIIS